MSEVSCALSSTEVPFALVQRILIRPDIGATAKLVAIALLEDFQRQGGSGRSVDEIAALIGNRQKPRSLYEPIAELERAKIIMRMGRNHAPCVIFLHNDFQKGLDHEK